MKTIKEQAKEIFSSHPLEEAIEATKSLRQEYIEIFGVKSWNGLVNYYKRAHIYGTPIQAVSEPESVYPKIITADNDKNALDEVCPDVEKHTESIISEDIADSDFSASENQVVMPENDDIRKISYMIYRNIGDSLEWFGHKENFYGHKEGDTATIVRNHSCGVSEAEIVAVVEMTYPVISLFHRCYKTISKRRCSYKDQYEMTLKCFRNLIQMPDKALADLPKVDTKMTDVVLNFQK